MKRFTLKRLKKFIGKHVTIISQGGINHDVLVTDVGEDVIGIFLNVKLLDANDDIKNSKLFKDFERITGRKIDATLGKFYLHDIFDIRQKDM